MKKSLMDELWDAVRCTYLSDLKREEHRPVLHHALKALDCEEYPLYAWNDAVKYLTDDRAALFFYSHNEAQNFLIEFCSPA
ncbi:MAG: hypothetical protein Q4B42_05270 [Oscillospiraceae bacterium]|nr:hypothetical protein [Oscillospiraceae bacterium]